MRAIRTVKVNTQYDYLPKYFKGCNLQGHNIYECRVLHLELTIRQQENETYSEPKDRSKEIDNGKYNKSIGRINAKHTPFTGSFPRRLKS